MLLCPRALRRTLRCGNGRSLLIDLFFIILFVITCTVVASHLHASSFLTSVPSRVRGDNVLDRFPLPPPGQFDESRQHVNDFDNGQEFGGRPLLKNGKNSPEFAGKQIDGVPYPQLSSAGNFIPIRRIVHLDLKGGAFKPSFFDRIFPFLKSLRATGVLLEWEDVFPYKGRLASAINGNAYSMDDVEYILRSAKRNGLDIIPLVQTFGHLEWILKLEQFSHLRESAVHPQVICFGLEESWELLREMIDEVMDVHSKFGMNFFHMGADEVFQVGYCNRTLAAIQQHGSRERAMLWHMSRVAEYIRKKQKVTVLAWHDIFAQVLAEDLKPYRVTELIEPVLWSYAEDLDQYLAQGTWFSLKPFRKMWASSAYKGADGPMRFSSNPIHYIRNNEAWISQMTANYRDFEYIQGIVITGWSRYDHMAILSELFPVGIPALAMSLETLIAGRKMNGDYPFTAQLFKCTTPYEPGFVYGCQFPGRRVYELINELREQREQLHRYLETDFEFNGWLSKVAEDYKISSPMYLEKVLRIVEFYLVPLERMEHDLREAMREIYFDDTIEEFIFTYLSNDLEMLRKRYKAGLDLQKQKHFPKRPLFVTSSSDSKHRS